MLKLVPLVALATAVTCAVAVTGSHAAPISAGTLLGKFEASGSGTTLEKARYRGYQRKWWRPREYRRPHHRGWNRRW
jgi:hypothetical protein